MESIYTRGKPKRVQKKAPRLYNAPESAGQVYKIPEDFVLVIDTREQQPLFNPPPVGLVLQKKALKHGDYSIYGFEDKVTIERKKMSDLMSYIGAERERTVVKLNAMADLDFKALVVEESWDDLFLPKRYSQLSASTIRQALVSFQLRFGLHIFVHPYRDVCERWILDRLLYFHKQQRNI